MRLELDACGGWSEHGRVQGCVYLVDQLVDSNEIKHNNAMCPALESHYIEGTAIVLLVSHPG